MATQPNPTIKQMTIDLSGKGGLADKWAGELISPTQLNSLTNYTTNDGEMMFGYFNPIKRKGYMSPNPATFLTVSPQVSFTSLMAASQVDEVNEDVYFFENGDNASFAAGSVKIQKADSFDDLTLVDDRTISSAQGVDLAIYTLYGTRMLFYAYHNTTRSIMGVKDISATLAPPFTADAGTDVLTFDLGNTTWTLWENRPVKFTTTTTLPAPLSTAQVYYLKGVSGATAQVSTTPGGAAVNISDTGTGTHTVSLYIDSFSDEVPTGYPQGASVGAFVRGKIKMIPSGDGFMYILTKNTVHRFDGSLIGGGNGTLSLNILTAPAHFFLSHGIDYRGNLYIVVQKNSLYQNQQVISTNSISTTTECGVYVWNRQSTFFNTSDYIVIPGVMSIHAIYIAPNGKVRVICRSSNKITQIREFNGTNFVVLKELGITSYPNYEDSLTVSNGFTTWLGSDTRLYYHGAESIGEKEILFVPAYLDNSETGYGGAIAYADGGTLQIDGLDSFYTSFYNPGTGYVMRKVSPNTNGTYNGGSVTRNNSAVFTGLRLLPRLSTVKHIDIYFAVLETQTTSLTTVEATIKIFFNSSSSAWATKSVTRADLNTGLFSIEVNKPFINSIQMSISCNANVLGTTDFCPSAAIVTYENTTTIK